MARRSSGKSGAGRLLLRRRRDEDRISALPDDLLLLILRRLDTRSALGAGSLSRRWAHLPRELAALDLRAGDMLPPRYHRWVQLYNNIRTTVTVPHYRRPLLPIIRRYERRAMRAFTSSTESLLEEPRRRVERLSLEFFITGNAGRMNRLIAEAVDGWGVEDLEAMAKPTFRREGDVHTFPSHGLCKEPRASRLQSLKLAGCVLPPALHEHSALTMLILQGVPESTPAEAYEDIFTLCPQLQTLHLISCGCRTNKGMPLIVEVDAPSSQIRELVVQNCTFRHILLKALPRLQRLASLQSRVSFESSSFPHLSQRNLTMRLGVEGLNCHLKVELDMFLECTPDVRSLIIRLTGPYRWIVPSSSPSEFLPGLRRLLVADVPLSWDVTWPRLLLEMAPSLETLHVHILPSNGKEEPGEEIPWSPTELRQHHLKEFVVAGFQGTARQICLIKFVVEVCAALCRLAMFKSGHVRYKGHWDWEVVTKEQSWSDDEKGTTHKQIMGVVSSAAPVQLVLG
ncbi:unnamed protein product [Urochloa decumbens]|uniref:F-box domain-containing protein n=1 Tax=Urochloa decumbens TaxID=240449 RepID=A0ABC8WKK1_9POAL